MSDLSADVASPSAVLPSSGVKRLLGRVVATLGGRALAWLGLAVLASLLLALVELGLSVFLQYFLKTIGLLNQEVRTFGSFAPSPPMLAFGLCALALIRSTAQFFVGQGGNVAMEMIVARLRRITIWEMLLRPSKALIPAGAIHARIGDLANKSSQFCYSGAILVSSAVQAGALVVVMIVTAKGETFIALAGLGVVGLIVLRMNRVTRTVAGKVPAELRVLTDGIERIARNTTLVRVLRTEQIEHRRLATAIDSYARYLVRAHFIGNVASGVTPFAGILLIIVIVALSQGLLHTPSITLLSFLYLLVRFVQSLSNAVTGFSACNTWWPSFKNCVDYVAGFTPDEVEAAMRVGETHVGSAVERTTPDGGDPPTIEVNDVTFAYRGATDDVLRNVSLTIEKGSQFAIVGPSGCGKSTLLALILGLYDATRGQVRIGGRSPTEFFDDPNVRVGYVGADAFLVAGSIRDNLRYGLSRKANDDDLWTALGDAQLRDAVHDLPGRLDYPIGEDGSGLSAGQKQRLCLARALLSKPHLLVLDEVSANLDAETERAIAESIKHLRGSCTTILVSHRKGILAYADHVLALDTANAA